MVATAPNQTVRNHAIDIAIGGAGSEQVILPNLLVPGTIQTGTGISAVWIPLSIRAGQRIALRSQSATGSLATRVKAQFIADTFIGIQPITRWIDWGTVLGSSLGTTITSSASVDTKGSYTQLVAANAGAGSKNSRAHFPPRPASAGRMVYGIPF